MKKNGLKYVIILAILSVAGILLIQFTFLKQNLELSRKQFREATVVALREVAWQLLEAAGQTASFDNVEPVDQITENYYLVNVNGPIDPEILKAQLREQFSLHSIRLDYEYAIFDPEKRVMVYGEYVCAHGDSCEKRRLDHFLQSSRYTQYFAVNFPRLMPYMNYRLRSWYMFAALLLVVILFFGYSLWVISRQRQLTNIQKLFINNLTHELKTPISSIALSAAVLRDKEILGNADRLFEYARIIDEQAHRLAGNVEKVLNLATLEKNRLKPSLEKVELLPFMERTAERFRQSALGRDAEIAVKGTNPAPVVLADPYHLANLLQNILENAVKYCVGKPRIELLLEENHGFVRLSVKDNGIGIPRDQRRKVFRQFYRVPTGNIHNVKGFGLGLDYVSKIVKAHGWKIRIDDNPGGGTIFTILIRQPHE